MGINFKSIKTQLIIYLVCFAIFLAVQDKDFAFLFSLLIAVVAAAAIESTILYLKNKTWQLTESSIISGLIIGFVLSADELWWKIALTAAIAILSKYIIRFKNKHFFNPAALGIFLAMILLGAQTQWNGTYVWYIVVPCGLYFVYKLKKLELFIGYALVTFALFGIQAMLQRQPFLNILGYLSYFYIFVMAIEPKTTPFKKWAKFIFGACLGLLIFILTQSGVRFDAELFSLLAMNAMVPLLNKRF